MGKVGTKKKPQSRVQSLDRAWDILDCFTFQTRDIVRPLIGRGQNET
ncbi:MAG: hypothetical protein FJY85_19245 [Deltaproteobacteria bacterium]|nr:hypothetical protein [Deltaproteobacteria bacterium]